MTTPLPLPPPAAPAWARYPAYAPSGVDWLGEVPAHWEMKRLRFLCSINPSKSEVSALPSNTKVSFLPMERVGEDGLLDLQETRTLAQVREGYTYFRNGDVVVAKITPCFENGKGALCSGLLNGFGFGTTELIVMRSSEALDAQFLFYLTKSHTFRNTGEGFMKGSAGQKRVPEEFVADFVIGLPSLPEQRAIAAFLDRETARMDALVVKKECLIGLLTEKRTALISHAITLGLDSSVSRKHSGTKALGQIPSHWSVKRLKFLANIKYGLGEPPRTKIDGLPMLRATNVERGYINPTDLMFVDSADVPYDRDPVLRTDDIIVVRSGAYTGDSAIVPQEYDGAISGYDMVVRAKSDVCPSFLAFGLLSTQIKRDQIDLCRIRAAQPHLNAEELGDTLFAVPPYEEQQAIAQHLRHLTVCIASVITKTKAQIGKLQEHRTALISAAVTGKIDARMDGAAPQVRID